MRTRRLISLAGAGLVGLSAGSLDAEPKLRAQVIQRGDFVLVGNTLAHDCAVSANDTVVVGNVVSCGHSGTIGDTGVDAYWQVDPPENGPVRASIDVSPTSADSGAVLALPPGASVTHAYLYWAAEALNSTIDTTATLRGPSGSVNSANAVTSTLTTIAGIQRGYQSVADVTSFVASEGAGLYRVSDVESRPVASETNENAFAGWWMAVFYKLPSEPQRHLALFDGFDLVNASNWQSATLSGFLVPPAGYSGKLGVVAFEGDHTITGDALYFNGAPMGSLDMNAVNPTSNFFNRTRSHLGVPVSTPGDLPQLTGGIGSMAGMDLDVVDVTANLSPGQTSAPIQAQSLQDAFLLAGFVTSITTTAPDLSASTKTATDLNGAPLVVGDTLEYTITVTNSGNDTAIQTIVTDPLPVGVTYVPGTLQIVSGPNQGAKTDAKGDDQADYDSATRKVTFRLGAGANGTDGGSLGVSQQTVLKFQVQVDQVGVVSNQATISAAGEQGAPASQTPTGHDNPGEPTQSEVYECGTNDDCAEGGICKVAGQAYVCVQCVDNSHCSGPTPTCHAATNTCICVPTGAEICDGIDNDCNGSIDDGFDVGEACTVGTGVCQVTGQIECGGAGNAICNAVAGQPSREICGDDLDSDCDGNLNNGCDCLADDGCGVGEICDTGLGASYECVAGCRGVGGNGCDNGEVCTSTDTSVGTCVQCIKDGHCGDIDSGKVCDTSTNECQDGCRFAGGNGCGSGELCTSTNHTIGNCVECLADNDCGDATSGKVCDAATATCADGCRGTDGNGCGVGETCSSSDESIGTCEEVGDGGTGGSDAGDTDGGDAGDTSDAGDDADGGAGGSGGSGGASDDGGVGGADARDAGDEGTDVGGEEGDGGSSGGLCAVQPGSAGPGAGWLMGGALAATALARRRRR